MRRWRVAGIAALGLGAARAGEAQGRIAVGRVAVGREPHRRDARAPVHLRLRPRAGDTVRTRFDQSVSFRAVDGDPAPLPAAATMTVYAHSVVEHADASGAVVAAVTDSVALHASGAPASSTEQQRRALEGRRSRLRIAPDGASSLLGAAGVGDGTMRFPAALPAEPVAPGAMWSRAMTVPWSAAGAARGRASVDVWFRFDSLARGGTLAYVSLRGSVRAPGAAGAADAALPPGDVRGLLVVDLARGWVTDSRATFQLDGALTAPGGRPRPVRVVVTQRLRLVRGGG